MNNKKRKSLKEACLYLSRAASIVSGVLDNEQDCLDNMPENLQYSDGCDRLETAIDKLSDAIDQIDGAQECIEEASA